MVLKLGRTQTLLETPRSWEQESVKYRGAGREDLYRKLGVALFDRIPPPLDEGDMRMRGGCRVDQGLNTVCRKGCPRKEAH